MLALVMFLILTAALPCFAQKGGAVEYSVSWLGNTFPGGKAWVQQDISDIYVAPDGTVYAITFWDEAGGEVTAYKEGKVLGTAGHTHGWGYHGGEAIAANSRYLYFAQLVENEGGGLVGEDTWPPKGYIWLGIGRRFLSDIRKGAPFPGGKGGRGDTLKGAFLLIHQVPEGTEGGRISGLWATERELYVSCPYDGKIRVYDAETMRFIRDWPMERPGPIAMDSEGMIWIVQREGKDEPARVLRFTPDGHPLPQNISLPKETIPTDICIDRHDRLWVTDAGPGQQVLIYEDITREPRLSGTFGEKGGIYAGPVPGKFGEMRFNHPTGVGVDGYGNVYVASDGSTGGGGTVLECYSPDGRLRWRLFGLEFVDMADIDPQTLYDETPNLIDVHTKEERFIVDLSKPPGQNWLYAAYTVDKFRYPQDPRLHIGSAGCWVRRIKGRKFLFVLDMNAEYLQIYRFNPPTDGEIAIPSCLFAKRHIETKDGWPPHQPEKGEWIWRDKNGNGAFDPGEYETRGGQDAPPAQGWWVDSEGNIWLATERDGIRMFRLLGLDEQGNPIWSYKAMRIFPHPKEFESVKRLRYLPDEDVMFLGGTTGEHRNQHWKPMGPVIARYDGWLRGRRALRWKVVLPYSKERRGPHHSCEPMTFDVAGDYIFVPYTGDSKDLGFSMGHVEVLDAHTGKRVGFLEPDERVGQIGLQDIRECLTAHRLANGEYLVFLEDDWKAKVLIYRVSRIGRLEP